MPEGNPLVAQPRSQTTAVTGIGIAESAADLANGVADGSWVEAGLGVVGVGLEVLSMVIDPIGTLLQYGVSWLIEHVQPLKEALDWLAGDPPVIQSFSETWANVAAEVNTVAGDLANEVDAGTSGWRGDAADAYRQAGAEQADALAGAATLADGISTGVMIMGTVVAAVRELVRDLVAELVGKLITWALEAAATLGFATPAIAVQATAAITKAVNRISEFIRKLLKTISNVTPRIRKIVDKLGEIIKKLAKLARRAGGGGGTTPSAAPSGPKVDAPTVRTPDGGTTPSSATTPSSTPDAPTTPSGTRSPDTPGPTRSPDGTSPSGTGPDSPPGGRSPDGTQRSSAGSSTPSRPDNPHDTKTPEGSRNTCNDPIDIATGEVVAGQVDVELPGVLPLVLRRTHVSSYRVGRSFGRSWASTLDQRLEFDDQGVVYVAEDGMLLVYPATTNTEAVLPRVGPRWPLCRTAEGYTITRRDSGQTLHFPAGPTEAPLTAVGDRNGNRIDFDRDSEGMVASVRHSGGYRIDVDIAGSRVRELRLRGASGPDVPLVRFGYDDAGHLTEVRNSSNRPMRFSYDTAGRLTQWTDRNGEWYRYFYDADGRCIANQGSGGFLNGTFSYERENLVTRFTDALGHTTIYQLNAANQVVAETDPLGNTTRQEWDELDRLCSRTDPLGRTTRFDYDDAGDLVAIVRPDGSRTEVEYTEDGSPTVVVDPDGGTWHREHDERGNVVAVTDPAGAVTRYDYDELGRVRRVTDALGNVREVVTDAAGLPIAVTDSLGATTRYDRDQFGRIVAVTDPMGGVTRFSWTVEGRLLSRTRPDGGTERWRYDGEGNQIEHVDVLGRAFRSETTHFDLPATQTRPDGSRTTFTYDADLRVVAVDDAAGLSWRYTYDAAGRLVRETDSSGRELRYTYDAAGQLVERVNGAGQVTRFHYDELGNLVRRESADTTAEFRYDPIGRMVRAVNGAADVEFHRDPVGRVLVETINGRAVRSTYDAVGRRVRRVTPTGSVSGWDYDGNGRHVTLRTAGRTMMFGFDAAGREVERLLDTGTVLAQSWDANHRLVAQTVSTVANRGPKSHRASLVQHREYRYHADGQLALVADQLAGTRRFELDRLGRVSAVAGQGWRERYAYDAVGNTVLASWPGAEESQGEREYAGTMVRRAGRVHYRRDAQGRITVRQKRRLSAKPDTWHYTWDSEDRLVAVVTPDGSRWRYSYDALGRRVGKERLGPDGTVLEAVHFVWDGIQLAEQIDTGGRATTWNFEPETFRPLAQVERVRSAELPQEWVDEQFYSIVTDLIGTPTELLYENGEIAWTQRTTVWGKALARLDYTASTPLRFPGQYHDPETGLNYNFQRYYDPEIGQYVSPDPLGAAPGPNPYGYAPNPLVEADPLGLSPCPREQIDNYRERNQVGKSKNIAIARYEIDGVSGESIGVSGKHQYPGSVPMPESSRFDPGWKQADSEWKMLEDIAKNLDPSAKGRIHIYSERPVCDPCQGVIRQFREAFPNIEVTYSDYGR
ncbi:RHS repeat-associated core domain-containing protein [Amycolatopsis arida]|uniref:RHS repeat-associated core domain-containing protein n=1 Tax=Amycolatopsis arida TaxID=587909 RepID=A0A1I5PEZ8_9PSEU|nr:DUF6531 domain-containing protein [Amycolatopsis arida]TDX98473.1 RHS repeat-associated protein [Amycolatopsis arida]SFP32563.1 RHS repeat-associated core domain-containing protein [Amycolatopsis arida]